MELKDKVVIITGGTRGLGKALALSFLKNGAKVVVCSRNERDLKDLEKEIIGIRADVTKEDELQKLLEFTIEKFNKLDIWINNAGIWLPHSLVENFDMEKVKKMFDVNVFGSMNGSRVALRFFKKQRFGCIVNIISDSALVGRPMSSTYSASKWAMNGFTKSVREENKNISIFSIYPSGIKTDIFGENRPDDFDSFMDPNFVADKIIENLKKDKPDEELIIKR